MKRHRFFRGRSMNRHRFFGGAFHEPPPLFSRAFHEAPPFFFGGRSMNRHRFRRGEPHPEFHTVRGECGKDGPEHFSNPISRSIPTSQSCSVPQTHNFNRKAEISQCCHSITLTPFYFIIQATLSYRLFSCVLFPNVLCSENGYLQTVCPDSTT